MFNLKKLFAKPTAETTEVVKPLAPNNDRKAITIKSAKKVAPKTEAAPTSPAAIPAIHIPEPHPLNIYGVHGDLVLSVGDTEDLKKFLATVPAEKSEMMKALAPRLADDLRNAQKVFSGEAALAMTGPPPSTAAQEILSLYAIELNGGDTKGAIQAWVRSPAHAAFAVDFLQQLHPQNEEALEHLIHFNPHFKDAAFYRDPDGKLQFITYGFEHEDDSPNISYFYKVLGYSDEEWLKISEAERRDLLEKTIGNDKKNFDHPAIVPTALKPKYLGPFSVEAQTREAEEQGFGWEVKSSSKEISSNRLFHNIRDLTDTTHQERGFHVTQVFELPKKYKKFAEFRRWVKHINDYTALKGMEEGLHANDFVSIPSTRKMTVAEAAAIPRNDSTRIQTLLPRELNDIDSYRFKYWMIAVRSDTYGVANHTGMKRIALEFRDPTRTLKDFQAFVKKSEKSIQTRVWEQPTYQDVINPELDVSRDVAEMRLRRSISSEHAKLFSEIYPECSIPYQFQAPTLKLGEERSQRLTAANRKYEKAMRDLENEVVEREKKGQKTTKRDVISVMQFNLATWAKQARVSELYQNF